MPHVPIFASPEFKGNVVGGLYGDVVEELDWGVGEVLAALKRHDLEKNTLVIFASDNGPFLSYGTHAGSAGPLREGKLTTFEGGVRVPCIVRWPGKVPAERVCDEPVMTIDLLPTLVQAARAPSCPKLPIDGKDVGPVLFGEPGAKSPHDGVLLLRRRRTARGAVRQVEAAPAARVPDGERPAGHRRQAGELRGKHEAGGDDRVRPARHRQPARLQGREDAAGAVRPDGGHRREGERGGRSTRTW